jgi:hypothetical protein
MLSFESIKCVLSAYSSQNMLATDSIVLQEEFV